MANLELHADFGTVTVTDDLDDNTVHSLMNGLCGNLARAVHEKFGGQLVLVSAEDARTTCEALVNDPFTILNFTTHLLVKISGVYYDARGALTHDEALGYYADLDYQLVEVPDTVINVYSTENYETDRLAYAQLAQAVLAV